MTQNNHEPDWLTLHETRIAVAVLISLCLFVALGRCKHIDLFVDHPKLY